ncbi:S9 family peptidase [Pusillimonas sp. CC-YST705]|uniref:prolyl oligopeptidase n=1 Tax=Mesopusillimonas faecipullorum TaxID=2755040 RepID=A0ABS8C897_9BURK|nr:prolyl oligopeptidase family serine peptidase [Mesopusillimonas faecipullorum]MCB5362251.1 S9 family peptidase [Mesopusillimonas faecipullorum]
MLTLAACNSSDDSEQPTPEPPKPSYPTTRSGTDSDVYFGRAVVDPYRWLEDIESAETDDWVNAQSRLTASHITAMPDYAALSKRMASFFSPTVSTAKSRSVQQNKQQHIQGVEGKDGKFYYQVQQQRQGHDFLRPTTATEFVSVDNVIYVADSAQDVQNAQALINADDFRIEPDDHIELQGHQVSDDGKVLAYAMVRNYADLAEVHLINLERPQDGPFLKIQNVVAGAFTLLEQGVTYSQPRHTSNPHVSPITYQALHYQPYNGASAQTWFQAGQYDSLAPDAVHEGYLYYSLATDFYGAIGRVDLAQAEKSGQFILDLREQNHTLGLVGPSSEDPSKLLALTSHGAGLSRLVEFDPKNPAPQNWREILPNSPPGTTEYVNQIQNCGSDYYAEHLVSGSSKLFHYDKSGRHEIALPSTGAVVYMDCLKTDEQTLLQFYFSSLAQPTISFTYNPTTQVTVRGATRFYEGFDPTQYEMRRLIATSKDGTQFPIYVAHKKGLEPKGDAPTLIYVYGGFFAPMTPSFQEKLIPLLESGGIYAIAQVRGGGEFGMAWHDAGRLLNKQNTYDDIAAAAEHLIHTGLTQPGKLALQGESNGGLSTAVLGLQRPDLFSVVFPTVGVLDLVRYDLFSSGLGWHGDYGATTQQAEFENLMKFSPLHNVKPQSYPPTYVFTGKTDGRVMPAHSYKYAATLQNTATGSNPYMLYAFPKDGHSLSSNWQQYLNYMWTAFFHHTNSHYTPPVN